MRFIKTQDLRSGMILARDVVLMEKDRNLAVLLKKDAELNDSLITRLNAHLVRGVFILNGDNDDIEIQPFIDEEKKEQMLSNITQIYDKHISREKLDESISSLASLVEEVALDLNNNAQQRIGIVDLKSYDDYIYHHSLSVALLAMSIGTQLNLERKQLCDLGLAGLLHDIGKVFIDKDIINKKGELSVDEMIIVRKHALNGGNYLLEHNAINHDIYEGIIGHHEKYNGRGYPYGLIANEIPLFARILAVADVYDALTSARSYRPAKAPNEGLEYIIGGSGILFDPLVVEAFIKVIQPYPVGSCILLSNDDVGIVIKTFYDVPLRPVVQSIYTGRIYDLALEMQTLNITVIGEYDGVEQIKQSKALIDMLDGSVYK